MAEHTEPVELGPLDRRSFHQMTPEQMMVVVANATTTVFTRLRRDGHPVSAVVGSEVMDGEIYTCSNVFRIAYRNVVRDPRCCVAFDIPYVASVSVIGRAEIIDDLAMVRRFFDAHAPKAPLVVNDGLNVEDYIAVSFTPNRRLFRIIPETMFGSDMRTLLRDASRTVGG